MVSRPVEPSAAGSRQGSSRGLPSPRGTAVKHGEAGLMVAGCMPGTKARTLNRSFIQRDQANASCSWYTAQPESAVMQASGLVVLAGLPIAMIRQARSNKAASVETRRGVGCPTVTRMRQLQTAQQCSGW
ncbi:hypothetical protein OEZ85_006080 [Tetradesmus obliquus]|uniref:Uncharacterized protein n=1 Tax=Tetradesmus obliquus TaxID=3088 RepID=A0ABY8UGF4_TETOB|nr:hypothetical protein OEZ85_006080 [Tetradesmus obliquus]